MFGWEFPPHISGGLGTACFGLTQGLRAQGVKIQFVIPHAQGDEPSPVISADSVLIENDPKSAKKWDLIAKSIRSLAHEEMTTVLVPSPLAPYGMPMNETIPKQSAQGLGRWNYEFHQRAGADERERKFSYSFNGGYGPELIREINHYAEVAAVIASHSSFDIIHAHDWLTFPAGLAAKEVSGKPLVVQVHATEYDRAGEHPDPRVLAIEQEGLDRSDKIIAVSDWTKRILIARYRQPEKKIIVVHNGAFPKESNAFTPIPPVAKNVVTFFGRITYQKGPQYFVEAAAKVARKMPGTHFVMAGSGDLLPAMIEDVARRRLSSRFHFTGFLRGKRIDQIWSVTNVYVMPSVSEPFGIAPLEAIRAGVPAIISRQSGVCEVLPHVLKVDFWDTDALADAIIRVLKSKRLARKLNAGANKELERVTWQEAARKTKRIYEKLINP